MANVFDQFDASPAAAENPFDQFTPPAPPPVPEDPNELGFGDALMQGAVNIPASGMRFAGDLYQAARHPIDTVTAMGNLAKGGAVRGAEYITGNQDLFDESEATAVADAAGKFYKDRYGSWDGFKNAIATDPVGVLSDASIPFTGGGSALVKGGELAGKVSGLAKAAKVANTVGRYARGAGELMDPVTLAGKTGKGVVKGTAAISSGLGFDPINAAYDAARAGGAKRQAFFDNMRGKVPIESVLREADYAAGNIEAAGQAAYKRDISSSISNPAKIDWTPIRKTYRDIIGSLTTSTGKFYGGDAAAAMRDKVKNIANSYFKDPAHHTIEGLDAMKKELQALEVKNSAELTAGQAQANRIATGVANAVKDEIVRLDPKYAETMAGYEEVASTMRELQDTFKTGGRASVDTAIRRLQSTMRNNANTNYGYRGKLLDRLDEAGHGTLRSSLAGQAMNTKLPRGLALAGGATAIPAAAAWAMSNPWMLAGIAPFAAAASPRVVGTVAGLLGDAAGRMDRAPVAAKVAKKVLVDAPTSRPARVVGAKAQNWVMEDAQGNRYDVNGKIVQ